MTEALLNILGGYKNHVGQTKMKTYCDPNQREHVNQRQKQKLQHYKNLTFPPNYDLN